MRHIFGPVPSRRLGQSLGIDPNPLKTCNWNCIYCQLGRTVPLTNELRMYYPVQDILDQLEESLTGHAAGTIDWITVVGSGEPTLYSGLGELISGIKELSDLPVAVITNGSLLYLPQVCQALLSADAVLPSLDAGTEKLYRLINRPHPQATFGRLVDGLIAFRQAYQGRLWVEVMLMDGVNDSQEALADIARVLSRIKPDEIHINLPTRPPAETWVKPAGNEALGRALLLFSDVAKVVQPALGEFDLGGCDTIEEAILEIISRHPIGEEALERALSKWAPGEAAEVLSRLKQSGRAQVVERLGERFWSAAESHYPDPLHSQAAARGIKKKKNYHLEE